MHDEDENDRMVVVDGWWVGGWIVVMKIVAWGVRGGCDESRKQWERKTERAANRNQGKKSRNPR
jgi:hypothetical protein